MATPKKLELKRFNMNRISFKKFECQGKGPVIVFIGRRDTGKSFLVKDFLYYHQTIPIGAVISGTEAGNGFYSTVVPKQFIHHEYKTEIVQKMMTRQTNITKLVSLQIAKQGKTDIDARSFLILDDCLWDATWARDKVMREVFLNGRHKNVLCIITMQYPLGIPPLMRTNIDYVFILRDNIARNRKILFENYAGMFGDFGLFCQIMDQCTENYECLVIDNNVKENSLTSQVFWYKAEGHGDFTLGSREFWEMSRRYVGEVEEEDWSPGDGKKKQTPVHVRKRM